MVALCKTNRTSALVFMVVITLCLSSTFASSPRLYKRSVAKRYAMMDLAFSQIYDLCDTDGDRLLTMSELRCVQHMGDTILGKRRK